MLLVENLVLNLLKPLESIFTCQPSLQALSGPEKPYLAGNGKVSLLYDPILSSESENLPVFQPHPRSEKASGCGPSQQPLSDQTKSSPTNSPSCVLVSPIYVVLCATIYNCDCVRENQP